jgi:transposase
MIEADKRRAVFLLNQEGMSAREIARRLQLSRNTASTILKQKGDAGPGAQGQDPH